MKFSYSGRRRLRRGIGIVAVLFFTLPAHHANAQVTLCAPDCGQTPFEGPFTHIACIKPPACPSCVRVRITFYTRIACGVWHDVQVTDVTSIDPVYSECFGTSIRPSYYFQQALLAIMTDMSNPTGFPPTREGQCATTWRVATGACQRIEGHNPDPTHPNWWYFTIAPCDPANCCLMRFQVCISPDGSQRTATPLGGTAPQADCPEKDPNAWEWGEECVLVCGWPNWDL